MTVRNAESMPAIGALKETESSPTVWTWNPREVK
jgi:hypothetical protein